MDDRRGIEVDGMGSGDSVGKGKSLQLFGRVCGVPCESRQSRALPVKFESEASKKQTGREYGAGKWLKCG
jgi:hypothetical protein